jgi:DNA-binding response OmpR family regulator
MNAADELFTLIVDDEPAVVGELASYLRRRGLPVLTASNATSALEILGSNAGIGALVVDVHMPGLSGIDLLARLHRDGGPSSSASVIMISALDSAQREVASRGIGEIEFLRKPFRLAELEARLRYALQAAAARRRA